MGGASAETSYSWDSGVLTDEQEYRFVVRVAMAAHLGGIETQNTNEVAATPNSDVPATPTLTLQLI